MSLYSLYGLMDKIHQAKKDYYKGIPKLTDQQYDALETSFKTIHGQEAFDKWYAVGYDREKHDEIKKLFKIEIDKLTTIKLNEEKENGY